MKERFLKRETLSLEYKEAATALPNEEAGTTRQVTRQVKAWVITVLSRKGKTLLQTLPQPKQTT
jgi:hypothetical protein